MDIVELEYQRDKTLKKEDVQKIEEWLQCQPHLPSMTEQEIIWFLKSCYSRNEATKETIDNYFTMKTLCPELFRNKDITKKVFQDTMSIFAFSVLPKKNHEGDTVMLIHFVNNNPELFNYNEAVKLFDMVIMFDIFKNGTQEGLRILFDMKGFTFSHLTRIGIISLKKFLYYLQVALPVRLKGLHFLHTSAVVDKLLQMIKPFLRKEIMEMLYLHESLTDMEKFIPISSLSSDYGGTAGSFATLNESMKKNISENVEFFKHQDSQIVDETKRPGKPKNVNEIFGVEGTFKKLDLD